MNTLNNEIFIYNPNTLDGENIVSSHLEENSLLIDGTNQMLANLNAGNHRVTQVSNAISSTDAINKGQLDLKADISYLDGNFLNKVTTTTQNVAGRLTFNSTTSGQSFPIIELTNAITGSNNGLYLRFLKNFNRLPNTEIGSIVFADKAATSNVTSRAVQLTASIDSASNPLLNITFDSGIFNPLTISNTQTILRNNDFYIKNKTTLENVFTYFNSTDKFTMSKPLDMNTTNKIINLSDPVSAQDASTKNYTDTQSANTNYLLRNGTLAMTGGLNMNSKLISNLSDPVSAQDASTKYYTDNHSNNGNYLLRNGTLPMTGNLQMGSYKITNLLDPFDLNDGANKYYVDTQSANTHYLLRNGTLAMTGALNMGTTHKITNLAEPSLAQDASTKNYTDTQTANTNYLKRDGSLAMTGALNMGTTHKITNLAEPSLAQDASTKNYTDTHSNNNNYLLKTGGTMTGAILMNGENEIRLNTNPASGSGARIYSDGGNTYYNTRGVGIYISLNNSANPSTNDGKIFISRDTTEVRNNFSVEGARKYNMKVYTANHTMIMNSETTGDMESIAIIKGSGITFKLPNENFNYWRNRWYIIKNGSTNNVTIDFNGNTYEGATGTMNMDARRQISLYFDENYGSTNPINKLVWNITGQSNAP